MTDVILWMFKWLIVLPVIVLIVIAFYVGIFNLIRNFFNEDDESWDYFRHYNDEDLL